VKEEIIDCLKEYLKSRDVHGIYKEIVRFKTSGEKGGEWERKPITIYEFCKAQLQEDVNRLNHASMAHSVVRHKVLLVREEDVLAHARKVIEERKMMIAYRVRVLTISYADGVLADSGEDKIKKTYLTVFKNEMVQEVEPDQIVLLAWKMVFRLKIVSLEQAGIYNPLLDEGLLLGFQKVSAKQIEREQGERADEVQPF